MTDIFLTIINLSLLGYIIYREYLYHKVIKDLTSKIKARDVYEYKEFEKPVKEETLPLGETEIPPEEATPEDYLKALQKEIGVTESARK